MQVIYGINPLLEMLRFRHGELEKIIIAKGKASEAVQRIQKTAEEKRIPVEFRDRTLIEKLAEGEVHQGVVGICRPFAYASLDRVIANRHKALKHDFVLILDGITDPQNLGALIRTLHGLGGNGVIIPTHRAASVTAAVIKASAGAAQLTPVAMVTNLVQAMTYLKQNGFWICGADAGSGQDIQDFNYNGPVALLMGSEGKGIRPLVKKHCDFLVSIPMRGQIDSLNVSVAAGIIMYAMMQKW